MLCWSVNAVLYCIILYLQTLTNAERVPTPAATDVVTCLEDMNALVLTDSDCSRKACVMVSFYDQFIRAKVGL